jgi:hypothetical protein
MKYLKFFSNQFVYTIYKIIVFMLCAVILLGSIYRYYKSKKLKDCNTIIVGYLFDRVYYKFPYLRYSYKIKDKIYIGSYDNSKNNALLENYFPVVVSCDDPENSQILIEPEDFEKFGMSFPDSLSWVIPILENE